MFPDTPSIRVGAQVDVMLRQEVRNPDDHIRLLRGKFLATSPAGVYLGEDMLHVEFFVPADMVGYIKVVGE